MGWRLWRRRGGTAVEAIQVLPDCLHEVVEFCGDGVALADHGITVRHEWGSELVRWNAMLLRDTESGRLSACDAEVFLATYEPVCREEAAA